MSAPLDLLDFARPPLVEVALSVQFEPLLKFRMPYVGQLWTVFRERFPEFQEHPPLPQVTERFGVRHAFLQEGTFQFGFGMPPLHRCWFLNKEGTELVQVQQDRFARNWRKVGEGDEYPRYERIRKSFEQDFGDFAAFLSRQGLGEPVPNQCEVTYVDHLVAGEGWQRHGEVDEVVTLWAKRQAGDFLPEPEEIRFGVKYVIPDRDGKPFGRLYVDLQPAFRKEDEKPMFVLNFVARGKPDSADTPGVLRFFDTGREWIVRAFASVTSSKMQRIWGRRDE